MWTVYLRDAFNGLGCKLEGVDVGMGDEQGSFICAHPTNGKTWYIPWSNVRAIEYLMETKNV